LTFVLRLTKSVSVYRCHERAAKSIFPDAFRFHAACAASAAIHSTAGAPNTAATAAGFVGDAGAYSFHSFAAGAAAEKKPVTVGVGRLRMSHLDRHYHRRHRDDHVPRETAGRGIQKRL
jgi:hypothetical protein